MKICGICGNEYERVCGICIVSQQTCVLCLSPFKINELVVQCKECHYLGHEENFRTWLVAHRSCPVCRIDFTEKGFETITLIDGTIGKIFSIKSDIYRERNQVFSEFSFRFPFYKFQKEIIDDIYLQLESYNAHLFISPPGSGKTIVALSLMSKFSQNTLVLVPNLAVLGSWVDRLYMFYDNDESSRKINDIYTRSKGDLKPITVLTYQQVNASLSEFNEKQQYRPNFHHNTMTVPFTLIDRLKDHRIGFLILDEAHKLTGTWGDNVQKLIELLSIKKTLGLTATPPQKDTPKFNQLFNYKKTELPLPMMVREGILVPYRDYSLIFPPEEDLQDQLNEIREENLESDPYGRVKRRLISDTLKEISLVNSKSTSNQISQLKWLCLNFSFYTVMTIDVILFELKQLGSDFRGLVLLDNENLPSKYNLKQKGIGGAIGFFDTLLQIPEINMIDPIFVTGKSLIIDTDFSDIFEKIGEIWIETNNLDMEFIMKTTKKKYLIVNGKGRDWNTDSYTRYVTYLFNEGHTKLLVGTKYLLGEGWDSQVLNTFIDLTTFSSYASVNQAKGRALRKNPDNPDKVANLWDFAPNPNTSKFSRPEFKNFGKRYDIYFGINEDGDIVNGTDRLNPYYSKLNESIPIYQLQQDIQFTKAKDRKTPFSLWKVGQKLGDLYYVINFKIRIPTILTQFVTTDKDINTAIRKLIDLGLQSLISDLEIKPELSVRKRNDVLYQVKMLFPATIEYQYLVLLKQHIENISIDNTMGIWFRVHRFAFTLFSKLFAFLKLDKATFYEDFCLCLPWEIKMPLESDITNITLGEFEIKASVLKIYKELEGIRKIGTILSRYGVFPPKSIAMGHDYESYLIQIIDNMHKVNLGNYRTNRQYFLKIEDFVSNHEYFDLD